MYVLVRSYLRKAFQIFNLGLIKKKDLNNLQSIYIEHISLINKLQFFIELRETSGANQEMSVTDTLKDLKYFMNLKAKLGKIFLH
jgi:hypothetical protein